MAVYSMQLEPFRDAYGADNIHLIFFERFVLKGQAELDRVCKFVGSQDQPQWVNRLEATNVSSQRMHRAYSVMRSSMHHC